MDSQSAFGLATPDRNLEWKFDDFSAFCRELQQKLGSTVTLEQVIDAEVGKVLERTIEATGKADIGKIQKKWDTKRAVTLQDGTRQGLYNRKTGKSRAFHGRALADDSGR